ncbi:MAG TPA: PASTA domain-containing protein [Bacteroidales bacterium]|jgi:beta-lactam-binding protein with PASTA domain|nr:PASTA domain-containing protein [Bacteroidales bacterium]MDI9573773.1 PASTA domain-containing protein [Bacteroidota bacterium]OQC61279.1 MAG: Serine/threonine-protein kinase PK-1 [Bacteroidetes bacterium ADurb.Bin012]HNQ59332.1 PASTA domain-containing protein [Bacteroidales bacterium]HNU20972.1 PASTA domain-containing protein [Bacteroidales bacterium]
MKFTDFIKSKLFFRNLALMVVVTLILIWLILQSLKLYTRHGQFILLPDFTGKPLDELVQFADEKGLKVIITDSIYDENMPPRSIRVMDPQPNTGVKSGRKIYVTIASGTPDLVPMPDIRELSLRQAVETLVLSGLRIDYISYVEGPFQNSVIGQRIGTRNVNPGELLPRNSKIVIVVEKGDNPVPAVVPDVIGLHPYEAYNTLFRSGLNLGKISFPDGIPQDSAMVIHQEPGIETRLTPGSYVSLVFGQIKDAKQLKSLRQHHQNRDSIIDENEEEF